MAVVLGMSVGRSVLGSEDGILVKIFIAEEFEEALLDRDRRIAARLLRNRNGRMHDPLSCLEELANHGPVAASPIQVPAEHFRISRKSI